MRLFRLVELPSDEPMQYVGSVVKYIGTRVIPWNHMDEPTVGFIEVDSSTHVEQQIGTVESGAKVVGMKIGRIG